MARKLRRYKFSGIERLTREQVRVRNALLGFLPQTPFERGFKDKLRAVIEPLVHADIDFWFDGLSDVPAGQLARNLGSPLCVGMVGLSPKVEKVLVEVDLTVAQQAIERMLGGTSEDVDGTRQLSEIEEGVFAFLLLKALRVAQVDYGDEQSVGLRLEGVASDFETLASRVDTDQAFLALSFKLFFDVAVGYVRVFLPRTLVDRDFSVPDPEPGPALSRYLRAIAARAGRVAALKTELVLEVGRIGLAMPDLDALEEEDIILVENPEMRLSGGALSGRVAGRVGDGACGLLYGALSMGDTGLYEVAIEEILAVGEPRARGRLMRGEEFMEQESSRRLSAPLAGTEELAARIRRDAAARSADGDPRPFGGADSPRLGQVRSGSGPDDVAEHSEGDYEDEGGYEEGGEAEGEEEPLNEAANMLGDVTVAMVVELGRVEVSAADIVGLRPGQVIELSRSPGDPVDLVVDNKRIGKGELVEIEGELGVRILSLVR